MPVRFSPLSVGQLLGTSDSLAKQHRWFFDQNVQCVGDSDYKQGRHWCDDSKLIAVIEEDPHCGITYQRVNDIQRITNIRKKVQDAQVTEIRTKHICH